MGQKLVLVVRQIVGIKRKRPIFKFKQPRDALFRALKAVLDMLLNNSPVYKSKVRYTERNNWTNGLLTLHAAPSDPGRIG